jgi:HEAT repeat protein
MRVVQALSLFLSRAVWRATGWRAAGRPLIHALGSPDEDVRSIAGVLLAKAGKGAEPLLREALARESLPKVLTLLADVGSPDLEPEIRPFSADRNPDVARAANEALRGLSAPLPSRH